MKTRKKRRRITLSKAVIVTFLSLLALMMIYPFYNVILVSLTSYQDSTVTGFYLLPRSLDFSAYRMLFTDATVPTGFLVTFIVTVTGTVYCMFLSTTMAYALSKKGYPGRRFFLYFVLFTMFFSGGLIPYYLVVRGVGLIDSIFSMVIPVGINTFYLILMKNYFLTIPQSVEESAKIDGANDFTILFANVLPIAAPILATITLFYAVDRWNEYFNAMLFIRSAAKRPIQTILRDLLVNLELSISSQMALAIQESRRPVYTQALRMAIVVVTSIPILLFYPYVQKYFAKGIMVGSIKA
jgi:putative aldouronate transport system permease protein